jgi:hypothetical protein
MFGMLSGQGTLAEQHIDELYRSAEAWRLARGAHRRRQGRRRRGARRLQPAAVR